ncbi:MAG: LysM peptidoglycan-binding domain-containing protein [Candidatus Shapirobacteria bacterium]
MVVVIIVGTLVYRYFQKNQEQESITSEDASEQEETSSPALENLPATYTVIAGDNLWEIAENYYHSGYNWVDIAEENSLANPNGLEIGQELIIPDVDPRQVTVTAVAAGETISQGTYTVQEGDWLSKIALRAYGDMFAWEKIYEANKNTIGPNPNLVEPGQVLTIPE